MDEFKKELEDYFCRFTFGQFVSLILLEVVTLFFVFYLGARYGPDLIGPRGTSGKEATTLPKAGPKSVDEIVGAPSVEYTYPEVLTGAEGQKAIRVKPSGMTAEEAEKKVKEGERPIVSGEPIVEAPPIEKITPSEKPTRQATPSETPPGKFAIQVGSYQSAEEASHSAGQWKQKGYSTFMSVGEIPKKGIWYRVRIGGFETRDEAQRFLEKFQEKEKAQALIVLSKS